MYPSNAPVNILLSDVLCSALGVISLNYMTVGGSSKIQTLCQVLLKLKATAMEKVSGY